MKKTLFLLLSIALIAFSTMSCTLISQGHVGLRVSLVGSDKGDIKILGPGYYGNAINVNYVEFPTYVKQYPFTEGKNEGAATDEAIRFQSKDGVSAWADVAVSCFADATKADTLYRTYRKDIDEIIHTNVRQSLRNAFIEGASTMSVDDLYGNKKIALIDLAKTKLIAEFGPQGLIIQDVSFLSDVHFPPEITEAIKAKYAAVQAAMQRENEVAKAKAEADIKIANARGEAEANKMNAQTITPIVLEMKRLDVQMAWVSKWNGQQSLVTGGNSIVDLRSAMDNSMGVVAAKK